jgi:spermidine/putrescine transport system permease protein
MADVTASGAAATAPTARKARRMTDLRRQPGFNAMAWGCIIFLYAPIVVLVAFSFNDNRSVVRWTEFSFRWYQAAFANDGIRNATVISLQVAAVATLFSTCFATLAALATTRTRAYKA